MMLLMTILQDCLLPEAAAVTTADVCWSRCRRTSITPGCVGPMSIPGAWSSVLRTSVLHSCLLAMWGRGSSSAQHTLWQLHCQWR
jgi:hypothetical protein